VVGSDFAYPNVIQPALAALASLVDVDGVAVGGHRDAERTRCVVGHPDAIAALVRPTGEPDPTGGGLVVPLRVQGNFIFDTATHRDFLGALLGTGIERSKVGDIYVLPGDTGCQVVVAEEMEEYLLTHLTKVRSVPVTVSRLDPELLCPPASKGKEVRSSETSMRLDAIASAGFSMSRTKMSDLIKKGDVRVNWVTVTKGMREVEAGDVISVHGHGRATIKEVGTTKKGRFSVHIHRQ
jgi:photosystem II S4 domain protein